MVKRYYIKDYPENVRGNTETRTVASNFIRPSIESSLTKREKNRTDQACVHVVRAGGFNEKQGEEKQKKEKKGKISDVQQLSAQLTRFVLGRKPQGTLVKNRKLVQSVSQKITVGNKKNYMEAFDIFPCYMIKFLCYSCSQL